MAPHSHRIFVGNLPHEVTRDQIVSKFKEFGNVESVEIKTQKDTSDQVIATFSYVNLNTDKDSLNQCMTFALSLFISECILLLNGIKWGQRHLKVEVAKESFLQRLQRERLSANKSTTSPHVAAPLQNTKIVSDSPSKISSKEDKIVKKNTVLRRPQSSSESSDDDDENDSYHPSSKLPRFKGISSVLLTKPVPQENSKKERFVPKHEVKEENLIKIEPKLPATVKDRTFKKFSEPAQSSDILKKFESFSDVWKDDEEEVSYASESKFNSKSGKKHIPDDFEIKKSARNDRQSHNHFIKPEETGMNVAEEKRLKSIEEKRQAFEQQKKAVQQALSDKNAPKSNKKIVFNDDDDEGDDLGIVVPSKKSRVETRDLIIPKSQDKKTNALALFDDSDEETADWAGEFEVKKQFEGQKGKKLLELQNKYNNDQRFKLDERFYESDEESKTKPDSKTEESETGVEGLAEEREQQLQILSDILGKPFSVSLPPSHHESKKRGMLRFDPLKPNHSRYELTKEPQEAKRKKKSKIQKKIGDDNENDQDENEDETVNLKVRREEKDPEPVSQSKFYSVSETLADSLKLAKEGQSSGFSLLQMFGSSNTSNTPNGKDKEEYSEVITKTRGLKKGFSLDDSSSEDEEADQQGPTAVVESSAFQSTNKSISGVRSTGGVWQESFFFQPNDDRLKEGADFFSQIDSSDPALFSKKREALKRIVKLKLRKTSRKANSFKNKVGSLRKKANLWPKSNNVQRHRKRQKQ
ncbi:putative RNA-binding protein [Frankliniella fusca]|uniref:RNA-binding protein n=1 Tax=Frankliniella fusca TaxID=407009 RepID=A0AAE1GTF6_9NEOP|nr:putative RNA-binding protein [Frankliniella fusca]